VTIDTPSVRFTTSFIACPEPDLPTWRTSPSVSRTGSTRSKSSSELPTKMCRVPAVASGTLPRTGASTA